MAVSSPTSVAMTRLHRHLERWHCTRLDPRAPIPDGIWPDAVAFAAKMARTTARALRH